jgi:hypothetical protein
VLKIPFSSLQVKKIAAAAGRSRIPKRLGPYLDRVVDAYLFGRLSKTSMINSERRERLRTIAKLSQRLLEALGVTTNEYNRALEDWQRHKRKLSLLSTMTADDRKEWLKTNENFYERIAKIKSGPEEMAWEIRVLLEQGALGLAIAVGGFPDFPPINDGEEHPNYRQADKLKSIVNGIALLYSLAANQYSIELLLQREKSLRRSPHSGDPDMNKLFEELIAIWEEFFGKRVTTTFNPIDGQVSGKFVDFVTAVLSATKGNLTEEARESIPKIERALSPTPRAIKARLDRTN